MTTSGVKAITAAIITVVACTVFFLTVVRSVAYSPEDAIPLPTSHVEYSFQAPPTGVQSSGQSASVGSPLRLIIPSIRIDAKVQQVGIAKSGNMMPPSNFTDVGWYKLGAVPGQLGSAVFAGHVDNALALPGVFKHLADVAVGDDVYVRSEDGKLLHFKVTDTTTYNYKDVPTDLIFNQNDKARIRLITCSGTWVQNDKSYNERMVVTAELVV
ncbi:MAG: class F sortase [Patescibacteria group bacterium]